MGNRVEQQKPKWIDNWEGWVSTTPRTFHELVPLIRLQESSFVPGQRWLSIGEGLSTYARDLRKKGIDCIALDPIYEIPGVLSGDKQSVQQTLKEAYGNNVDYMSRGEPPLSDRSRLVAATASQLPFTREVFDHISLNFVVPHIDLSKSLPEILRVLSPSGEVRIFFPMLQANPSTDTLFSLYTEGYLDGYVNRTPKGLPDALAYLDGSDVSTYISLGSQYGEERHDHKKTLQERYDVDLVIIRKDNREPRISAISHNNPYPLTTENPYTGSFYKVGSAKDFFSDAPTIPRTYNIQRVGQVVPFRN